MNDTSTAGPNRMTIGDKKARLRLRRTKTILKNCCYIQINNKLVISGL